MKVKQTMRKRAAGFVRDWSLPRQAAGESHHSDGGQEHDVADACGRGSNRPIRSAPASARSARSGAAS